MDMLKSIAKARERVEGLDYTLHAPARPTRDAYDRWRRAEGLTPFRKAWWVHSRLERYAALRHYALLLDWALAEPGFTSNAEVLPLGARVIVFRFGHLGDMLHLMPTLAEIKNQRPDVNLELVTGPWNLGLLSSFAPLDAIHVFTPDAHQYHRGRREDVRSFQDEKAFIRSVRGDGVDLVFCPSSPHFCELPLIVGLRPARYVGGEWALERIPVSFPRATMPFDSRHYELNAIADFLPLLGLERSPVALRYDVSELAESRVNDVFATENPENLPVIAVFPGSGWPGKCWPAERFVELLNRLYSDGSIFIALGGSLSERGLCESICHRLEGLSANLAGRLSLVESAALIKKSALLIGNDSAPVHLAAALGCPTVSLWGPTFSEK